MSEVFSCNHEPYRVKIVDGTLEVALQTEHVTYSRIRGCILGNENQRLMVIV